MTTMKEREILQINHICTYSAITYLCEEQEIYLKPYYHAFDDSKTDIVAIKMRIEQYEKEQLRIRFLYIKYFINGRVKINYKSPGT
jgi:hypothetical protein